MMAVLMSVSTTLTPVNSIASEMETDNGSWLITGETTAGTNYQTRLGQQRTMGRQHQHQHPKRRQ